MLKIGNYVLSQFDKAKDTLMMHGLVPVRNKQHHNNHRRGW